MPDKSVSFMASPAGIILGMGLTKERRHYNVMPFLIGQTPTQNDHWTWVLIYYFIKFGLGFLYAGCILSLECVQIASNVICLLLIINCHVIIVDFTFCSATDLLVIFYSEKNYTCHTVICRRVSVSIRILIKHGTLCLSLVIYSKPPVMWEAWDAKYGGGLVHSGHTYNLYVNKRADILYLACLNIINASTIPSFIVDIDLIS